MALVVAFILLVLPFSAVEGTFGVQIFGPHFSPLGASQSNGWVGLKSFPTQSGASETLNSEYSHALYPIGKHQFLRIPVKGGLKVVPAPRHLEVFKGNHDFVKHDVPLVKKPPLTSFGGYHFRESSHLSKHSERPLISVPGTGNSIILIHGHPLSHHVPLHTAGHLDDSSHSEIHINKPIKIVKSILASYPHSKSHPVKFPSSIISSHKSHIYPSLVHKTSHIEGVGVKHDLTHSHHHSIGGSLLHSHKSDVGHSIIPSHHSAIGHDLSHAHHADIEHDLSHDHHSDAEHDLSHDHHSDIAHEVHDHHSDIAHQVHDHHSNIAHEVHDHHSDIAHQVHNHHSDIAHEVHDHHSDIEHEVHDHHSDSGHGLSHGHHSAIGHDIPHDHHSDIVHDVHDHHSDIGHDLHDHHSDIGHALHDHSSDIEHGLSHGYHSHIGHHLSHGHSHIGHILPHVHTAHIKHRYHSIYDSDHSEIHDDDDDEDDEEEVIEEHGLDHDDEHHIEEEHNSYAKKIRDYKLMRLAKKIQKPITKTEKKKEEKPAEKPSDKNSMKKFPPSKHFKNPPEPAKDEKMEDMGKKMEIKRVNIKGKMTGGMKEKMEVKMGDMKEKMMEDMKQKMMENMKEEMIAKMKEEIMENMKEEMIENMNKKMMEKMKGEMMGSIKKGGMKEEIMGGMKEKMEDVHKKMEDMEDKMEGMDEKMEEMDEQMEEMDDELDHVPIPRKPNVKFANPSYMPRKIESSKLHKLEDAFKRFQTSHHRSAIRESKDFRKLHDKHPEQHPINHEESHSYFPKILKSHEAIRYSGGRHPVRPVHKYVEQKYFEAEEPEKTEDVGKKITWFRKFPLKVEQQEQAEEEEEEDFEPKHEVKAKSDSYGHVLSHSYRESRRPKPVHFEYKSKPSLPRGRSKIYRNYEEPHTSSYAVEIQHSRKHGNAKKGTVEDRHPAPKKVEVDRHETQQKEEEEEDFDYLESQLSFTEESLDGQKYGDKLKKE